MIQNHRDSITTLPPGAVLLATSDACRVQAFRVGAAAWGVQFHPEADAARLTTWNETRLAAVGIDRAELVAQAMADSARQHRPGAARSPARSPPSCAERAADGGHRHAQRRGARHRLLRAPRRRPGARRAVGRRVVLRRVDGEARRARRRRPGARGRHRDARDDAGERRHVRIRSARRARLPDRARRHRRGHATGGDADDPGRRDRADDRRVVERGDEHGGGAARPRRRERRARRRRRDVEHVRAQVLRPRRGAGARRQPPLYAPATSPR